MGIVGALVIANWSYGLMCDTGGILLDMNPDEAVTEELRRAIESGGDRLADLHVWRDGCAARRGILPFEAQPVPRAFACHDRSAARDR